MAHPQRLEPAFVCGLLCVDQQLLRREGLGGGGWVEEGEERGGKGRGANLLRISRTCTSPYALTPTHLYLCPYLRLYQPLRTDSQAPVSAPTH